LRDKKLLTHPALYKRAGCLKGRPFRLRKNDKYVIEGYDKKNECKIESDYKNGWV